jgi:hypothetical protein
MGRIFCSERVKIAFLTGSNELVVGRTRGVEAKHPLAPNVFNGSWLRENVLVAAAGPIAITPEQAEFDVLSAANLELILRPAASL